MKARLKNMNVERKGNSNSSATANAKITHWHATACQCFFCGFWEYSRMQNKLKTLNLYFFHPLHPHRQHFSTVLLATRWLSTRATNFNCLGLTEITCNANVPPACGSEVFYDVPSSVTLYVPDSSLEEYKETSPWNNFLNIVAISEKEDGILKMVESKQNDSYFDLQGREIVHPLKGIFIRNGKKVVAENIAPMVPS